MTAVPRWQAPMLATLSADRFSDDRWVVEHKLDGVRCLAFRDGEDVRLLSRNQKPMSRTYPELVASLVGQPMSRFVVDGEVVAFDGRRTSFERLQGRLGLQDERAARLSAVPVFFVLFDLLHLDGHDVTGLPLTDRKALLQDSFDYIDPLRFSAHRRGSQAERMFAQACARGDEGLVVKRAASTYRGGRSTDWLKFKCVRDQELVIGGWTEPAGSRHGFGALLVGHYEGGDLVYAGKVGTGFDERTLSELTARLAALETTQAPFTRGGPAERDAHWVRPELIAQVGFSEWTRDGRLRHPRFQGLRDDRSPTDVVRET